MPVHTRTQANRVDFYLICQTWGPYQPKSVFSQQILKPIQINKPGYVRTCFWERYIFVGWHPRQPEINGDVINICKNPFEGAGVRDVTGVVLAAIVWAHFLMVSWRKYPDFGHCLEEVHFCMIEVNSIWSVIGYTFFRWPKNQLPPKGIFLWTPRDVWEHYKKHEKGKVKLEPWSKWGYGHDVFFQPVDYLSCQAWRLNHACIGPIKKPLKMHLVTVGIFLYVSCFLSYEVIG